MNPRFIPVMIGTTHHHSRVEFVGTSLNYVKVDGNASDVPEEWVQRKIALGAVYDYDAKCHIHLDDPSNELKLSKTERAMNELFRQYDWMVFRGDPGKQKQRPDHIEPKCQSCDTKYPYANNPPHMGIYPGHTETPRQFVKAGSCAEAIAACNIVRSVPDLLVSAC